MNSLSTQYRRSQLVARPVPGEQDRAVRVWVRVPVRFEPVCYQFAQWVVGDFNGRAEKVCENFNRWFRDHYGVPVRVIRWGAPDTARYIPARRV